MEQYISYNLTNNTFIIYDSYNDMMEEAFAKNDDLIPFSTSSIQELEDFKKKHTFFMSMENILEGLTPRQKEAIELIDKGFSVFITGPPGTGKSFLLDRIIKLLKTKSKSFSVTATTGCAAVNINGRTLHSLFLIKPFTEEYDLSHVLMIKRRYKQLFASIQNLDALIIDEVSMLDDRLCDGIDNILRIIKDSDRPFGGIQVIFVGDFFQLPPITNNFCFLSSSWRRLDPRTIELNELMRQKNDCLFQKILMAIRKNKIGPILINHLRALKNTQFENGIIPTRLFPKNIDVDEINKRNIEKLKDGREFKLYPPRFKGVDAIEGFSIELCYGAQVMITRNIDITNGVVNGTRGMVCDISDDESIGVRLVDGRNIVVPYTRDYTTKNMKSWIEFMPVKIAYAISIHKSQGMTLDALEIDLGDNIFEYGQAYTALSRGTRLDRIKIVDVNKSSFKIHPIVKECYIVNNV